jgi:hypothetical protein
MKKEEMEMEEKEAPEMESESENEGEEEGDEMEMDSKWKAECDANDLLRAAEIKADPERMKAAMAILDKKKAAIESMDDLMAVRKAKMLEKA